MVRETSIEHDKQREESGWLRLGKIVTDGLPVASLIKPAFYTEFVFQVHFPL